MLCDICDFLEVIQNKLKLPVSMIAMKATNMDGTLCKISQHCDIRALPCAVGGSIY